MPKSNYGGKSSSHWILEHVHKIGPLSRVVDVGPGMGTYTSFRQPGQHWTGVEAWAPYVREYDLHSKYDQVIVSDVRYFDWRMVVPLDLVIFGDILEHMTKQDALVVLDKALTASRIVMISVPIIHAPQGESHGNPFEVHVKEDWSHEEALQTFTDWCVGIRESYIGVYILSRKPSDAKLLKNLSQHLRNQIVALDASGQNTGITLDVRPD